MGLDDQFFNWLGSYDTMMSLPADRNAKVAVIDSGYTTHADGVDNTLCYNVYLLHTNPDYNTCLDYHISGHGSGVVGVISSKINNDINWSTGKAMGIASASFGKAAIVSFKSTEGNTGEFPGSAISAGLVGVYNTHTL